MQIKPHAPIRPIPARRKSGEKLDASKNVTNFEDQIQAANKDLKRRQQRQPDESRGDGHEGGIDVTA